MFFDQQGKSKAQAGRLRQELVHLEQLPQRGVLHGLTREHQLSRDLCVCVCVYVRPLLARGVSRQNEEERNNLKERLPLLEILLGDYAAALGQVGGKLDALKPLAVEPVLQQPHTELLQVVPCGSGRLHSCMVPWQCERQHNEVNLRCQVEAIRTKRIKMNK